VLCQHERVARTIVIVDDHDDFRSHAAALLTAGGYDVVGSCHDGRSALSMIAELLPDVVLLDVQLPDIDGFAVIEQVDGQTEGGAGPVLVLVSTREAIDYGGRIAQSGAAGFINKAELSARSLDALVDAR
jgi:DNA-binding NarL/FixJ family response regulator